MSRIIATYRSENAPAGHEAVAMVFTPDTNPKRKGKLAQSFVVFHASTEEAAKARAEAWWTEREAAEERKAANYAAMAERRRKPLPEAA